MPSPLLPIIAHARAGALDHALALFRDAGLDGITDDHAVLSLKGRLLKDQARRASGEGRRRLYAQSAEAYGAAGAISGASYPLINAATLSLLAGDPAGARALAGRVLARLDDGDEQDTEYWRQATRAEAELLLDQIDLAKTRLHGAVRQFPAAWEDHASTLRQFALILEAQGRPADWLEPLRPPRALYFAGHMGVDPDDRALAARVAEVLAAENIGFGYGALAAGADIVVAEALLARQAELHLVLPAPRAAFREASVAPFGKAWEHRFDRALEQATTVTVLPGLEDRPDPLSLRLAGQAAMGRAAMQARLLATEAVQLVVSDSATSDPASFTHWAVETWGPAGRRSIDLAAPRVGPSPAGFGLAAADDGETIATLLLIPGERQADVAVPAVLDILAQAGIPVLCSPTWTGQGLLLSFETCEQAVRAGRAAAPALEGGRMAGSAGIGRLLPAPPDGALLLGRPVDSVARLAASAPPGAALVDALFAWLLASGAEGERAPCEPVGELPPADPDDVGTDTDLGVYSLSL